MGWEGWDDGEGLHVCRIMTRNMENVPPPPKKANFIHTHSLTKRPKQSHQSLLQPQQSNSNSLLFHSIPFHSVLFLSSLLLFHSRNEPQSS